MANIETSSKPVHQQLAESSSSSLSSSSSRSWYRKFFFKHWKNRNRIGPARVELPDCDFFIVGTRRTLRVLRPTLKSEWYYTNDSTNDKHESINDNFFTRWSRRPHSSNHCRCSFRQSNGSRLSITEEQIISAELNRIRNNLCDVEKSDQAIEELEQRVSANLQKLQAVPNSDQENFQLSNEENVADEQKMKNKIVKDLERYINVLLEEILDDTVKFVSKSEDRHEYSNSPKSQRRRFSDNEQQEFLKGLSFSFHANDSAIAVTTNDNDTDKNESLHHGGYVNHAFIGSTNDPDSLAFYVAPINTEITTLDPLDCTDSGINSVETVEFQADQEPSLEQSLLRIIDEKFGRTTSKSSLLEDGANNGEGIKEMENNSIENGKVSQNARETIDDIASEESNKVELTKDSNDSSHLETTKDQIEKSQPSPSKDEEKLEEIENEELKFDKARLEIRKSDSESSSLKVKKRTSLVTKLREKISTNVRESKENLTQENYKQTFDSQKKIEEKKKKKKKRKNTVPIEMEDYRKKWPTIEESKVSSDVIVCDQNPRDFVVFRRNFKPTVVFLHGFGSSAEIFEPQLEYFSARGYPCIAPDILGHGISSAPDRRKDYHFGKLLKDLEAVLRYYAFKPGQKCVLVAHNYGCSFATALACKYDNNIHQLVLISGGGPIPLAPPAKEGFCQCFMRAILSPFIMCGLHRDILYSARGRQHPYCGPEPVEQWPSHMKYVLDGMVWPEGDYVFHRRICTPTLLVHGLRDNKVSLVQECQMERTMMKAYLEAIPTAGHTPMTDCPEQLNHMIHCFIDLWKNKNW